MSGCQRPIIMLVSLEFLTQHDALRSTFFTLLQGDFALYIRLAVSLFVLLSSVWYSNVLGLTSYLTRLAIPYYCDVHNFRQSADLSVNAWAAKCSKYCDMTPESRNSGDRARRPLLDNGLVIMFPQQRIRLKKQRIAYTSIPRQRAQKIFRLDGNETVKTE
jgi:hypothetical protein